MYGGERHEELHGEKKDELVRMVIDAEARIVELEAGMRDLRVTARLLLQNSEGCAVNHYGEDFARHGEPGWLRDCRTTIENAEKLISQ